jgi:membrane-bound lytic murein transglycosylase D
MRLLAAWGTIVASGALTVACAHGGKAPVPAPEPPATPPPLVEDPDSRLIATADAHLGRGTEVLQAGHLNQAREEFDRAVDVYLNAPGGAFASARRGEAYRRTLETIHVQELAALAQGDGFTETLSEPAAIDAVGDLPLAEALPAPVTEESRRTAEEVVRQDLSDLPIELNEAVLSCIQLYQGTLREWFEEALARGGRYLPHIRQVFASEGIPEDLAYVALVESAFKTGALSRAKAKGVWQFMPRTGREYGLRQDWWVDERSNPEKATRAAARYLKFLKGMFGDWDLALAAYNAGPGKVIRGLKRYQKTDYWDLRRTRALKRETKNYVPMIHAAIVVAKAPEEYGFSVEPEAALAYETVPVDGAVDLRLIAECAGVEVDEVKLLNPELRRFATPAQKSYDVNVPQGSGLTVGECLGSIPPEKRVRFRTHVVARGQTLSGIARRYGTRVRDIAEANGLNPRRSLRRGAELIIPIAAKAAAPPKVRTASARTATGSKDAAELPGLVKVSHKIKAGETLSGIASQYRTTIRDIQAWNKLRGSRIAAGHVLTIYTSGTSGSAE